MFTHCPSCKRQFRVRARQLAQAEGLVQCGFCGKQFSALERLYDKPLALENEETVEESLAEPEFFIPEMEEDANEPETVTESAAEFVIDLPEPEVAQTPSAAEFVIDKPEPEAAQSPSAAEFVIDKPEPEAAQSPVGGVPVDEESPEADYPFPGELAEEEVAKAGMASRLIWSVGVLLLLLAGTVQLVWFNRDMLLSQYPQFLPQARQVCQYLDCTLVRLRNISAIKLLNRDVRVHPRYEDALLVNATMTNLSRYAQRFPTVLFSLLDTNGKVTAYRRIPASVYLDNSIDVEAGMVPNMPVHFVLEVDDAGTGAVSFEFDFL